jgi:hypothetical protein
MDINDVMELWISPNGIVDMPQISTHLTDDDMVDDLTDVPSWNNFPGWHHPCYYRLPDSLCWMFPHTS